MARPEGLEPPTTGLEDLCSSVKRFQKFFIILRLRDCMLQVARLQMNLQMKNVPHPCASGCNRTHRTKRGPR